MADNTSDDWIEKLKTEIIPEFTDKYIDEWSADGSDISGLHKIIDEFAEAIARKVNEAYLQGQIYELEKVTKEPRRTADTFHESVYVTKVSWLDLRLDNLITKLKTDTTEDG